MNNQKPTHGWTVDGATSVNPGPSEYRCVDIVTGEIMFHINIGVATNNVAEYIALGHAILEALKLNGEQVIYSDSTTAISWIRKKFCSSSMANSPQTKLSNDYKQRVEAKIKSLKIEGYDNTYLYIEGRLHIKKWDTKSWGEIPADFGRK